MAERLVDVGATIDPHAQVPNLVESSTTERKSESLAKHDQEKEMATLRQKFKMETSAFWLLAAIAVGAAVEMNFAKDPDFKKTLEGIIASSVGVFIFIAGQKSKSGE